MISRPVSRSSSLGLSPGLRCCVVFLGKALHFHNADLSTQVYKCVPANFMLLEALWYISIPSRGERKYSQLFPEISNGEMSHACNKIVYCLWPVQYKNTQDIQSIKWQNAAAVTYFYIYLYIVPTLQSNRINILQATWGCCTSTSIFCRRASSTGENWLPNRCWKGHLGMHFFWFQKIS